MNHLGHLRARPVARRISETSNPSTQRPCSTSSAVGHHYLQDFWNLVNLNGLIQTTAGDPAVVVGVIDGPVRAGQAERALARPNMDSNLDGCADANSIACRHGTFVAGLLAGQRDSAVPGICPQCRFVLRPIFCEISTATQNCPEATAPQLAQAIGEAVDAGARVINLSIGLVAEAGLRDSAIQQACDYAAKKQVLLVAASGNQSRIGHNPLFGSSTVILVSACDVTGRPSGISNLGLAVGRRGLMAPGVNVAGQSSLGGWTRMSGTSVAAPFVTGAIALLWSLMPDKSAEQIRRAILLPGQTRSSIIPPLLNAQASWQALN